MSFFRQFSKKIQKKIPRYLDISELSIIFVVWKN
ncbi:hypothetical protein Phi14:2_gp124 [Cellulophaga phage phi14:2]|uniref:Uncharacterized protein n=1 Tax=Cellulophaga phage phi14:2 TaxID=1327990 RepID=S0A3K6_9CAUD|nr:hypothetical protein Phi14:2_gp124 [Cellulophaga phage phi14:2]